MDNQVHKYDRMYGSLIDVSLKTKPTTVKTIQPVTGRTETFIVQTLRHEDGDYIFLERADEEGLVRIVIPPKVANAIAAHREALTKRRRSIASRTTMANRMAAGEVINFKKKGTK
jgi:hypothetical protein